MCTVICAHVTLTLPKQFILRRMISRSLDCCLDKSVLILKKKLEVSLKTFWTVVFNETQKLCKWITYYNHHVLLNAIFVLFPKLKIFSWQG